MRYTVNQVIKAVGNAKKKLVKKAQAEGLNENFGQTEYEKLKGEYCPIDWQNHYANRDEAIRCEDIVQQFGYWCINYAM